MKYTWQVATAYVGGVIGAGFVSGQEFLRFFGAFGRRGEIGVLIVAVGLAVVGAMQLQVARKIRPRSYKDLAETVCGKHIGHLLEISTTVFLFAGTAIMIAGGGAVLQELLGWSPLLGNLLTAVAVGTVVTLGTQAVLGFNQWLVTAIVLVIAVIAAQVSTSQPLPTIPEETTLLPNWWIAAFAYLAYNSVMAMGLFANLGQELANKRGIVVGAILGGAILGALCYLINRTLSYLGPQVWSSEIPMLLAARQYGTIGEKAYAIITWGAMATTAVVNTYALSYRLGSVFGIGLRSTVIVIGLALPVSFLGFAELIEYVYPIFGYVGLIYLGALTVFTFTGIIGSSHSLK